MTRRYRWKENRSNGWSVQDNLSFPGRITAEAPRPKDINSAENAAYVWQSSLDVKQTGLRKQDA